VTSATAKADREIVPTAQEVVALAKKYYYFHPTVLGKTSVKKVCDAIWKANPDLRAASPKRAFVSQHRGNAR